MNHVSLRSLMLLNLGLAGLGCVFVGCQSPDPLAVFGPHKVPAPSTTQGSPYYPPTATTAQQPSDKATAPARLSISVETPPPPTSPIGAARLASDPTDRQPIRVVENSSAGTRTAAANPRGTQTINDGNEAARSTATAK